MKNNISNDRKKYLNNIRKNKCKVILTQILVLIGFILIWEFSARFNLIDSFITSSPSRILATFLNAKSNNLGLHIGVTAYETILGFVIGSILGALIAIILWWSNFLQKVFDPYLVVLNSLPKVALRANYYFVGWSRNEGDYCNGNCDFSCGNYT